MSYTRIKEICGNTNLIEVIDLGNQSLAGVFPESEKVDVPKMPLILIKCHGDESTTTCTYLWPRWNVW